MTDVPAAKSFLGVPIIGTPNHAEQAETHKNTRDLAELLRPLVEDDFIHSFGWTQFTPYFNDGEPCIFRATDFWVRTVKDVEDTEPVPATCRRCGTECARCDDVDESDDGLYRIDDYTTHPTLGRRAWMTDRYEGDQEERYERARDVMESLTSREYRRPLIDLFGDHCSVTVSADGITIDGYVHHD